MSTFRKTARRNRRRTQPKPCTAAAVDTGHLTMPSVSVAGVGHIDPAGPRRGRPPGSSNGEYAEVAQVPACCPKCHAVDLTPVRGAKVIVRDIAGVLPCGFKYVAVRWTRHKCHCGQLVAVRTYLPSLAN